MSKVYNFVNYGASGGLAVIMGSLAFSSGLTVLGISAGFVAAAGACYFGITTWNFCSDSYEKFKNREKKVPSSEKEGLKPGEAQPAV